MKIVAGITDPKEAGYFAREADELYCGVPWLSNHREGERNVAGARELSLAARAAASLGRPLYVAANEIYPPEEYPGVLRGLRRCLAAGAAGFIVRDPGLLFEMRRRGLKARLTLSSLGLCFNAGTLRFYRDLGVSRVVLPQHLSVAEAACIVRNRLSVETETFYFPQCCCPNVDGACPYHTALPRLRQNCRRPMRAGGREYRMAKPPRERLARMFYGLLKAGCGYVKLARDGFEEEVRSLAVVREAGRLAAAGACEAEFLRFLRAEGGL